MYPVILVMHEVGRLCEGVRAEPLHACDRLMMSDAMAHDCLFGLHDGAIDHDEA